MQQKLNILLLTIGLFAFVGQAQAGQVNRTDSSALKASGILNIEKIKRSSVKKLKVFGDFRQKTDAVIRAPVVYIENSSLAEHYRNQPLLFGFLTTFTVASLGALAFISHLIRNDPRFF